MTTKHNTREWCGVEGCKDCGPEIEIAGLRAEIDRVTAERDRLREALKAMVVVLNRRPKPGLRPDGWEEAMKQAKAALGGKGEEREEHA